MPAYRVCFLKHVYDHRGFDHRICQASFEISAVRSDEALSMAQRLFCSERNIPRWQSHADESEIELLARAELPKRHTAARLPRLPEALRREGGHSSGRTSPRLSRTAFQ